MAFVSALVFCFSGAVTLSAQNAAAPKQADDMDWVGQFKPEKDVLTAALAGATAPADQAELYWRLARATLNIGDTDYKAKAITQDQALKVFEEGEAWADKALALNPGLAQGYYWKSANIGMWGQTKGILDSLFKVGPMHDNLQLTLKYDPEFADAFYVLGELYEKVPGWPLSFGNVEYAVSLGRKSIDLMEPQIASGKLRFRNYSVYISLAHHLWARNWDAERRAGAKADQLKQYNQRADYLEKNFYYEGTLDLKPISDRDEAREIVAFVIKDLEGIANRSASNESDLKSARDTAALFK